MSKTVHAYKGFKGTYSRGSKEEPLTDPYLMYVVYGDYITIKSPNLVNAEVTYDGNYAPSRWVFDEFRGEIYISIPPYTNVGYDPSYGSHAMVINVTCQDGEKYMLTIFIRNSKNYISARINGNQLEASIMDDSQYVGESELIDGEEWTLDVSDVMTNENKVSQRVSGSRIVSVDTSGWKPGIYVVRAMCGDEVLTKKIVIK